eukprot:5239835-Amphidinium_carterae.4
MSDQTQQLRATTHGSHTTDCMLYVSLESTHVDKMVNAASAKECKLLLASAVVATYIPNGEDDGMDAKSPRQQAQGLLQTLDQRHENPKRPRCNNRQLQHY